MAIISIARPIPPMVQQIAHFYSTHSVSAILRTKEEKKKKQSGVVIEILKINGS